MASSRTVARQSGAGSVAVGGAPIDAPAPSTTSKNPKNRRMTISLAQRLVYQTDLFHSLIENGAALCRRHADAQECIDSFGPEVSRLRLLHRIGQHQARDEHVDELRLMFPSALEIVLIAHRFIHFFCEAPALQHR